MRVAREKFGNQKGELVFGSLELAMTWTAISSDQYFGRGSYDPVEGSEAQQRLQQFQGATAISSNAYFGRPEEDDDEPQSPLGGEGMLGLGDNETIQGLERGIRDMAGRVMGSHEVQNLTDQVRAGALKVSTRAFISSSADSPSCPTFWLLWRADEPLNLRHRSLL